MDEWPIRFISSPSEALLRPACFRAFRTGFFIRALDLARILPDPLVGDRSAEDRAKQPVGVGDRNWPERRVLFRAGLEFDGPPGPHVLLPDVANAHLTEGRGKAASLRAAAGPASAVGSALAARPPHAGRSDKTCLVGTAHSSHRPDANDRSFPDWANACSGMTPGMPLLRGRQQRSRR